MRFTSNEGQNMAPDVILILIKGGGLESILLNTINPFYFRGEQGLLGGIHTHQVCSLSLPRPPFPNLGDMEVNGQ